MSHVRTIAWWYWLVTGVLLAGALTGCPLGFAPPIGLTLVHTLHFVRREGSMKAFPVQVRIGYLLWMLAGLWAPLGFFHWIQLSGTTAAVLVDYCPMARMVSIHTGAPMVRMRTPARSAGEEIGFWVSR